MKTFSIRAPSDHPAIEEFIGKAYSEGKPFGLYASNGEDWADDRDAVIDCLMGKNPESSWFLCVKGEPKIWEASNEWVLENTHLIYYYRQDDLKESINKGQEILYVGYIGHGIMAHGPDLSEVIGETISEGWAHIEKLDQPLSRLEDLEIVQNMVESIEVIKLTSKL